MSASRLKDERYFGLNWQKGTADELLHSYFINWIPFLLKYANLTLFENKKVTLAYKLLLKIK